MTNIIANLDTLEVDLCRKINRLSRLAMVESFFKLVSRLGDGGFWIGAGVTIVAYQGGASWPAVLHMGLTAGFAALVYRVLKRRLARERPYITHTQILCNTAPLDRYSFPSGHTMHAVCLTVMIASYAPELLPAVLPFAILVALSRVILGLHYPSDVAAGAALGTVISTASLALV